MNRIKKPLVPATVVALLIAGIFAFNCKFSFADAERPERGSVSFGENGPAPHFNSFKTLFADIAEEVIPTVVSVIPTKIDTVVYYNNPFYRFFDSPFDHFFGQQRQPRRQQAPEMRKEERRRSGIGSGVIVSEDGYILTNYHVVAGADEIRIQLSDEREFEAEIIGSDSLSDVAVIKIAEDVRDLPVARLGDSDKLRPGAWTMAVGNPLALTSTVTVGIVSALNRGNIGAPNRYQNFIQTDAAINPGNSGGALVNIDGELIGINTMIWTRSGGNMGIGFAIPINMARWIMESLIYEGDVKRGWLGVGIKDIDEDMREHLGLPNRHGVLINEVYKSHPASKAGIKTGDVILSINGVRTEDANKLRNTVAGIRPGSEVSVTLFRNGKKKKVEVTLARRDTEAIKKLASGGGLPGEKDSNDEVDLSSELGFKVADITPEIQERFSLKRESGVAVVDINQSSLAARKGLRPGDLITTVQVQKHGPFIEVPNVKELKKAIKPLEKGDTVILRVARQGHALLVALRIED
ncbi:MAG: Do family serine endopeptidase [Chitinivibrionales bacterium]|nr:Do family serine endopeptidase [Chitinivibrionales bacterium]MBD3355739.1 Do family serine endopeptidase [Chitinivibrionales bacterium]